MLTSARRLLRLTAAAVLSVLTLTVLTAVQANAGQARCEMTWRIAADKDFVDLTLRCLPNSTGDSIGKVILWADDTWSDDLIYAYPTVCVFPGEVTKEIKWRVYSEYLDEDLGDRDEIYAVVSFKKPTGKTYTAKTNTIAGWWGKTIETGFGPPKGQTLYC